jgi:single-strand DNA-binding protein
MISATVTGNLGQDAELRFNQGSGDAVLSFSVASNEKTSKGEKTTTWVRCNIWGKRAEALAQYLRKGAYVVAVGTMSQREYEPRDGGAKRTSLEMRVAELDFRSDDRDGGRTGGASSGAPARGGSGRGDSRGGYGAGARSPAVPADAGDPPADDYDGGGYGGGGDDRDTPFITSRGTR